MPRLLLLSFLFVALVRISSVEAAKYNGSTSQLIEPCPLLADALLYACGNTSIKTPPWGNLSVSVTFFLQSFIGVDTLAQTVKTSILARLAWTDERLAQAFTDTNCTRRTAIPVPQASLIWYPKFSIVNSIAAPDLSDLDDTPLLISKAGEVYLHYELRSETACDMDLSLFPFDVNICHYHVVPTRDYMTPGGSKTFTDGRLSIQHSGMVLITKASAVNSLFSMKHSCTFLGPEQSYLFPHFYIFFDLRRNPTYYWPVVFVPTAILSALMAIVFATKAGDDDKLSIALTVLLSNFVVSYSLSAQLPTTSSNIPYIYYFYSYLTGVDMFATFFATLVRRRHQAEVEEYEASDREPEKKGKMCSASGLNTVGLVLYCLFCIAGYAAYFALVLILLEERQLKNASLHDEEGLSCVMETMEKAAAYIRNIPSAPTNDPPTT